MPVRVVATLDDALLALRAELDENLHRMPLSPTELVRHSRRLEELERPAAKERQKELGRTHGTPSGKLPEGSTGRARDKVAAGLGVSGRTLQKAQAVADAAEKDPENFGDLPAKMDATGKVIPAKRAGGPPVADLPSGGVRSRNRPRIDPGPR